MGQHEHADDGECRRDAVEHREVESASAGQRVGALVEVAQLPGEQTAEQNDDGDNLPPIAARAGGDVALAAVVYLALLDDAAPHEDAVDGHHEVVDADGAVGVDAAGKVDDGIEGRHQQAERPKPPVCLIFADDIEQADDCADSFEN